MACYYKKSLLLLIALLSLLTHATPLKNYATVIDSINRYGVIHIADTLVKKDLSMRGSSHLDYVKVKGLTSLWGSTHVSKAHLNRIKLYGAAHFADVTVKGEADIHGALQVRNGVFKSVLSMAGDLTAYDTTFANLFIKARKVELNNCKVQSVEIDSDANTWRISLFGFCLYEKKYPTHLDLTNSVIDGDVVFKGPMGTVEMDSLSSIKGCIVNGNVVKK